MKQYNIAVIGATGNVGRETTNLLAERNFPIRNITAVASANSIGKEISFGDNKSLAVIPLSELDYSELDIIFACTTNQISQQVVKQAQKYGVTVIDKSSYYRMDPDVPLIVPEVNPNSMTQQNKLIANPNCCVVPLVTALKPLDNAAKIKKLVISTYQSVSGAGKKAMDELYDSTKARYMMKDNDPQHFQRSIAFNLIPQIDEFDDKGHSGEEQKIIEETQKIIGHPIAIDVTSVRVPVFVGHSLSVHIEFAEKMEANEAEEILEEADSISVMHQASNTQYITPFEAAGEDLVYVSRIRNSQSNNNCINMWIVCDNLRKGAALNAVQIAEKLITKTND